MIKIKKIVIALIVSFVFTNWINAQNNSGYVIYKKLKNDNTSLNVIKDLKTRMFLKKIDDEVNNLEYKLKFSSIESIFKVVERMDFDGNRIIKFAVLAGGGNGVRYSNIKTKESLYQKEAYGEEFLIFNNLDSIKWNLTNISKMVGDYKCYKAITSKTIIGSKKNTKVDVIAWYAPNIPVNFGPVGYAGLPGLILELQVDKFKYYMTKLELNSKKKNEIEKPSKGKKIALKDYLEYEKKLAGQARSFINK